MVIRMLCSRCFVALVDSVLMGNISLSGQRKGPVIEERRLKIAEGEPSKYPEWAGERIQRTGGKMIPRREERCFLVLQPGLNL